MTNLARLVHAIVVSVAVSTPAASQTRDSEGLLKICKKDKPDHYDDPKWWRREVVVPAGVEFRDVGPIADVTGDWIRLKVVTMQGLSLKGNTKCGVVRAMIPSNQQPNELGRKPAGPTRYTIQKNEGRLLEVMSHGDRPQPPPRLGPWADVVTVEATIESDFE